VCGRGRPEVTKRPSDTHKRTKQEHEARSARETKSFQPLPARWVSGTLTGHVTTPQTVGNSQPIVSFEYRVALVPAASAYVSNPDVSLVRANMGYARGRGHGPDDPDSVYPEGSSEL
jgi:hypothetical protein